MLRRETLYTLASVLCVVALACGDDDERDDAGASGAGGEAAEAGTGGRGGTGGPPPRDCRAKAFPLDAWCEGGRWDCGRSQSEWLNSLCESRHACAGSFTCTRIVVGPNSCGGSSILAIYGIDSRSVMYHYDAAGELVGVLEKTQACPWDQGGHRYGAECSAETSESAKCPDLDADGGTDDAGI